MLRTILVLSLAALPTAVSAAGWRAGVGRVDITPKEPVWLSGYAMRNHPSEGIAGPIQAKALALEDSAGEKLVAASCDLLTVPRAMASRVAARIAERYSLPRSRILLCATHSHSSPVIRDALLDMYPLDDDAIASVDRYTARAEAALLEAACAALDSLAPAKVLAGGGRATFAKNRRKVQPGDPVDHDVPLLLVEWTSPAGDPPQPGGGAAGGDAPPRRAVLFAYACHNTTLQGYDVCGDYAGFAQTDLEKAHPGLTAIFAAGCAGDQNPLPRSTMELARKYGGELADAVTAALAGPLTPIAPQTRAAFAEVPLPLVTPPGREQLEKDLENENRYIQQRARRLLERLESAGGISPTYPYAAQVWRLGEDFCLVALAGEVVVEYSLRLKKEVPAAMDRSGARVMVIAYANDCPGYIPSEKVLREGGYEGEGAMIYYQLHGPWATGVEQRVVAHALALVEQTQRAREKDPGS
ncbi:MAG: neutral/alkaline non-lysosomal ceramidase N-terminal domain-containing protein [Planctomycetes bacterium]|nr:neutral/alkaline non-lysosomal ceramidase N-terminal domain-containing protein [Planctomycetota bacterium]